jgi:hypothetical protein
MRRRKLCKFPHLIKHPSAPKSSLSMSTLARNTIQGVASSNLLGIVQENYKLTIGKPKVQLIFSLELNFGPRFQLETCTVVTLFGR